MESEQDLKNIEDLGTHLRSAHFSVLAGAMKLLDKEPEIRFYHCLLGGSGNDKSGASVKVARFASAWSTIYGGYVKYDG